MLTVHSSRLRGNDFGTFEFDAVIGKLLRSVANSAHMVLAPNLFLAQGLCSVSKDAMGLAEKIKSEIGHTSHSKN